MGGSSSKALLEEPLLGYKLPGDRRRMRGVRQYARPEDGPTFDPTYDGYDYLIIFDRPEAAGAAVRRRPRAGAPGGNRDVSRRARRVAGSGRRADLVDGG